MLDAWTRFYKSLLPYRDGMVVGDFTRVTTDLGPLIEELNGRFGTAFTPFVHTPENVERVFAFIDERAGLATIEHAWELGIRYFDVAPLYGYGTSERRLGRILAGLSVDQTWDNATATHGNLDTYYPNTVRGGAVMVPDDA